VFSAQTDADLDWGVGAAGGIGRPDGDGTGRVDGLELSGERVDGPLVEDAHVDDHLLRVELERPPEEVGERLVCALLEQVTLRDHERDGVRQRRVGKPDASAEVRVVQTHAPPLWTAGQNPVGVPGRDPVQSGNGKYRSAIPPIVTAPVRRAFAFALVGTLALAAPLVGHGRGPATATLVAIGPFLAVAAFALTARADSTLFELFARPGDRRDGKLYGLAAFTLAAAGVAILTVEFGMPTHVYVGTVFLLGFGNLSGHLVRTVTHEPVVATGGFVVGGFVAGIGGQFAATTLTGTTVAWQSVAFLAASGSLIAALLREAFFKHDDALVLVTVALLLWLVATLPVEIPTRRIVVALGVTVVLGYLSFALDTASLPGMITGVLLGLLTIVLGDYGWFAMLIAFFGIGGLSSKFRYTIKRERGIAEGNEGARGTGNVLANSVVALVAVLAAAGSPQVGVQEFAFFFAFAGAVAAALADTLASEIGGLFDNPRLITTMRVVEPGTDGAVTWQGELVGLVGAGVIAAIAFLAFESVGASGAGVIVFAGAVGMTVDSILGATIEGWLCGNQGVNFLATLAAALAGGALAIGVGVA